MILKVCKNFSHKNQAELFMPKFNYVGVAANGKQVKGEIQAANKNEVVSLLRKKKVRAISIKTKQISLNLSFGSSIKLQEISRFTRQLAAMTSAGLPLVQCLDILVSQTENKNFSQKIQQISSDIQVGSTLADAMSKHPQIFNALYCNMVAAGEASGNLDGVLNRVAEYQEKSEQLRRRIKGAMMYPMIVSIVAVLCTGVMLTFIVPTFANMFTDLGGTLPLPTRIIMALSDFLRHYLVLILIAIAGLITGYFLYDRTENGKYNIDAVKLNMPILGDLVRKGSISRFSQTFSTLLTSGVTILEALSITAKTAGNKVLEKGLLKTLERISGGQSIADPLKDTGVFPPMVIQMIAVGEKTGDLSGMLSKISDFYKEEVDAAVDALTSILEPIMILVLGVIIGGMVIAMYLPMFNLIGAMG
jgi:type IV pilus assembly protein PilC